MHYGLARHFGANVDKHLEEKENMDDQTNIELIQIKDKILKNTNDIYALNLWKKEVIARLDQGIENRTKAFERIEVLEKQVSILKDLLDRYFTLEINEIEKSHGKRK